MKVTGINHINIAVTSAQLPDVVAFYKHVIGLTQGLRATSTHKGVWLYCDSTAIIHLSVVEEFLYAGSNTHFNHVALACSGVDECLKILEHYNIHYKVEFKAAPEMTQVFVFDPVGIRLELNFADEKIVQ